MLSARVGAVTLLSLCVFWCWTSSAGSCGHRYSSFASLYLAAAKQVGLASVSDHSTFTAPGQIALPGGSMEKNEALMTTALREAFEEVGIQPNDVDVIGEMTPLPVPVSRYLIYPFIGITEVEPKWILNKKEVDELIVLKFLDLINSDNGYYEEWNLKDKMLKVPIFKIMNIKIWGATAAILSELIDLSKDSS